MSVQTSMNAYKAHSSSATHLPILESNCCKVWLLSKEKTDRWTGIAWYYRDGCYSPCAFCYMSKHILHVLFKGKLHWFWRKVSLPASSCNDQWSLSVLGGKTGRMLRIWFSWRTWWFENHSLFLHFHPLWVFKPNTRWASNTKPLECLSKLKF